MIQLARYLQVLRVIADRLVELTPTAVGAAEAVQGFGLATTVASAPRRYQGHLGGSVLVGSVPAAFEEVGQGERQVGGQHVQVPAGRLFDGGDQVWPLALQPGPCGLPGRRPADDKAGRPELRGRVVGRGTVPAERAFERRMLLSRGLLGVGALAGEQAQQVVEAVAPGCRGFQQLGIGQTLKRRLHLLHSGTGQCGGHPAAKSGPVSSPSSRNARALVVSRPA